MESDLISRQAVRYKLTALVNEFEEILSHIREREADESVCGLCEYDGAYVGESGDWCNDCPGFDKDDCFKLSDERRKNWLNEFDLPSAQQEPQWIPCGEKLPDNRVCVIVCFREWQQYAKRYIYSIVMGWYARKHSVRENDFCEWEADCDYDEDDDEYYIHEGWYEFTTQGNADLMNWYINAEVVAWMPLPEPYREATL